MWFRSRHKLKQVYKALAKGQPDKAFIWLERVFKQSKQASVQVQVAAAFALFDEAGTDRGIAALGQAARLDSDVCREPLFRSLKLEFETIAGQANAETKRDLRQLMSNQEALVRFHVARALLKADSYRLASRLLSELTASSLPSYLQGLRLSMLGEAYALRGKDDKARQSLEQALIHLRGKEKDKARFSIAESYLKIGRPTDALLQLDYLSQDLSEENFIRKRYLEGVAYRHSDRLEEAFVQMHEAFSLVSKRGHVPFEILLEMARLFADIGQLDNAFKTYKRLLTADMHERHSTVMHEYAKLLKTNEHYEEAKDVYQQVVSLTRYPERSGACAELAMVEYHLGNLEKANALALYALEHGATVKACICLGNIALEQYQLTEAIDYFEKAIADAPEGEVEWLTAELLLTQALTQRSQTEPERVIMHAEKALRYLHPADEWVGTLETYISDAKDSLKVDARVLN